MVSKHYIAGPNLFIQKMDLIQFNRDLYKTVMSSQGTLG